jgi:hypothetical protein
MLIDNIDPNALIGDKANDAAPLIDNLTRPAITGGSPKGQSQIPQACDFALYCERNRMMPSKRFAEDKASRTS